MKWNQQIIKAKHEIRKTLFFASHALHVNGWRIITLGLLGLIIMRKDISLNLNLKSRFILTTWLYVGLAMLQAASMLYTKTWFIFSIYNFKYNNTVYFDNMALRWPDSASIRLNVIHKNTAYFVNL